MGNTGIETTSGVGAFPGGASPYGVEEMSGNVWEWCSSLKQDYPYDPKDGREEMDSGRPRVLRGGSFYNSQRYVRCAYRNRYNPGYRYYGIGFRVVVSPFDSGL